MSSSSGPTGKSAAIALLVCAQLLAEALAALAGAQVAADRGRRAAQALGHLAELVADLVAGQQARLGRLRERDAGAHEQRLHRRDRGLHRLGDLLVGERVDLAQQERRALRLRQVLTSEISWRNSSRRCDLVGRRQAVLGEVHVHRVDADRLALRRWLSERLRAIRYSHGRTLIARASARIALKAAAKTSCSTSSASSRQESMWRQKASSRDW